jgi:hypothetical protein
VSDRGFGEGYAVEAQHAVSGDALKLSLRDLGSRGNRLVHFVPRFCFFGHNWASDMIG